MRLEKNMRQNKFFQLLKINKFTVFFTVFLFLCIISAIVIKLGINVHGLAVFKNNISNFFNQSAVNKSSLLTKSFEQNIPPQEPSLDLY
ncbi:hypothetical protein V2P54_01290 [Mycoplasmoides gallisepticum]|uniref:hypothetical protein n=1 Tax=Mycoplasmoides gallisepticum TaxID=2096 RepID=UPI003DA68735